MTDLTLPAHEGRLLAAHLDRLLAWDNAGAVRVVARGQAVGIYSAPPMGVLAFVALPLAAPVADPLDASLTLTSARAGIVVGNNDATWQLDDAPAPVAALAVLPPGDGWHLPIQGVSGDVIPGVEEAVAEFRSRAPHVIDPQVLAEQLWDRPAFGGLPMRMLHAACRLGFLADDGSRVTACTTSGWKRLTTVRGQVFVRTVPPGQRALKVVR